MTLAVEVYDASTPWLSSSLLHTFSEDGDRSVRVARSAEGTWSVAVPAGSTDAAAALTNRWVKFRLDGEVIQSGRIRPWDQDTIAAAEEAGEDLVVNGPGLIGTLRDAIVYPHEETGRLARDTRFFNFASPDYDDSAWGSAVELFEQGDAGTSLYGVEVPENWPDATAWWIWGVMYDLGDVPPMPVGDCYFRTRVSLASEGDYAFFITADDGYELWVDGVLLGAQTEAFIFRQTYRIDQFLDAGWHTIAIKATNMDRPSSPGTNFAGLLFALYSTTAGGELAVLQVHSDDTWECLAYPARPPGFTPGQIVETLFWDAWDRGSVLVWSYTFSPAEDSNGLPWPLEVAVSFRFSDTIVDVLNKLAATWVEFSALPEVIWLEMFVKDTMGSTTGVELERGVNIGAGGLRHSGDPSIATDMLTRDAEGILTEVSSGLANPVDAASPRIEAYMEGGTAADSTNATDQAEGLFDAEGAYRVKVTCAVEPTTGDVPFADFAVGDTITAPDRFLAPADTVVEAIVVADIPPDDDGEEEGSVSFVLEGWQEDAA